MKKLLSLILAISIVFAFAACGKKNSEETAIETENEVVENEIVEENEAEVEDDEKDEENIKDEEKEPVKEDDKKPADETEKKPETKPEEKPEVETETKPETKPEKEPVTKPETKPEVKPETTPNKKPVSDASPSDTIKPEAKPETNKTVGDTLLAEFKKVAKDSASALSVAETLMSNEIIAFAGGATPVEEGYLTGFDNTEIKGFKEGAMFAPMIGTLPFVGYVFTLENGANANDFISTLKGAANLRWNICTEADEMVTGSAGNKVFFVMSPKSFEEE